jgi:hypothetical protein
MKVQDHVNISAFFSSISSIFNQRGFYEQRQASAEFGSKGGHSSLRTLGLVILPPSLGPLRLKQDNNEFI